MTNAPTTETKMTAAPKSANKMTAAKVEEPTKMVRVRALQDFRLDSAEGKSLVIRRGQEIEVTDDQARALCKPFPVPPQFQGEGYNVQQNTAVRAERCF